MVKKLTELEGCALGLVWANGPCTPYFIRRIFQVSPSPFWSGSAGAIYPLFERLERHGLVHSLERTIGKRRSRHYSLSPLGKKALLAWLRPHSDWIYAVPPDPLRTRMDFLHALPPTEKAAFLADAKEKLQSQMGLVKEDCAQKRKDGQSYLVARGAEKILKARLEWINEVITSELK